MDLFYVWLRNYTVVNSKVIAVTVRPEPRTSESHLEIELAHLTNVSANDIISLFYHNNNYALTYIC